MEVFETSYLPLWLVTSLHGYKTSLLGGEFTLGSVAPPWSWAGHHPQRGVSIQIWWSTTSKTSIEYVKSFKSYFNSISVLVKYFDLSNI